MNLYLREATKDDMDLLFCWANDSAVRRNAFHTEQIPYENHVKWFEKMMADESVYQYICCRGDEPVGQIRLNIETGEAVIDYSVSAKNRGKGYGAEMLRLIQKQMMENKIPGVIRITGQVKHENRASARAFEKSGFTGKEMPEYIQYESDLSDITETIKELQHEDYHSDGKIMEY